MTKVSVGGVVFTIEDVNEIDHDENILGQTDHAKGKILLRNDMPKDLRKMTLLHELVHAWTEMMSENKLTANEKFVSGLAMAMFNSVEIKEEPID